MNLIDAVQVILVESQVLGTVTLTRDSQKKVPGPAASTSPKNLLEMKMVRTKTLKIHVFKQALQVTVIQAEVGENYCCVWRMGFPHVFAIRWYQTLGVGCEHRCSISFPSLRFYCGHLTFHFLNPLSYVRSNSQDVAWWTCWFGPLCC